MKYPRLYCLFLFFVFYGVNAFTQSEIDAFNAWCTKHNKRFPGSATATSSVYYSRLSTFTSNMADATSRTTAKATYNQTKFSHLTSTEWGNLLHGFHSHAKRSVGTTVYRTTEAAETPSISKRTTYTPNSVNWNWCTDANACTGVYDQGLYCGSDWAFAAIATIESYWYLAGHTLTSLSMQQLLDCDTGDYGCSGGDPGTAYAYVGGASQLVDSYSSYPYASAGGNSFGCAYNSANGVASITSSTTLTASETAIYEHLSAVSPTNGGGPVSVCLDASTLQNYVGGLITDCGTTPNYCGVVVGYGNYGQTDPYWIVRFSLGTGWGESGFARIAIGSDLCMISDMATYVTI